MIGRLRGEVAEIDEEEVLVDVAGVGYRVRCGVRTLARLPAIGDEVVLHIEAQWSEAAGLRLYGFSGREEKRVFAALQAIQGVGPKAALGVLDVLTPVELSTAVLRGDKSAVARANGVGPKLAQRIVQELKDKPLTDSALTSFAPAAAAHGQPLTPDGEAVLALMGLGWPEVVARRAVDQATARLGNALSDRALIKGALQELGR